MSGRTVLLSLFLVGCGTNAHPPDADSGMDAATEAGTDAGTDSGRRVDSGDGCSGSPSTSTPMCGTACPDPCGCFSCDFWLDGCVGDRRYTNCSGGCIRHLSCGPTQRCYDFFEGARCIDVCEFLEGEYNTLAARTGRCSAEADCHVLDGHCSVGLGDCQHAVRSGVLQAELDALAAEWVSEGCDVGRPVCDCPAPLTSVRCADEMCEAF